MTDPRLLNIAVVVFDIDDTLFLEEHYIRSGFAAVGAWVEANLGVPEFATRCQALHDEGLRGRIFDRALSASGLDADQELISALVELYRSHTPKIHLEADAARAIERLRHSHRLAAVSDGPLICQQKKVTALELARWLDPIVLTGAFAPAESKPHPRAFRAVEAATGCAGDQCLYLADNPTKDFEGPHALGWRTIRVRRAAGLYREREHVEAQVDRVVPDLGELPRLLGR